MPSLSVNSELTKVLETLKEQINHQWPEALHTTALKYECIVLEINAAYLKDICSFLYHEDPWDFKMLIDLCGTDYQTFGCSEWETNEATYSGFDRGINSFNRTALKSTHQKARFAVDYQLLSLKYNQRLHLRTFAQEDVSGSPILDSITRIWNTEAARWYEREAFDLFGIVFKDHSDLRRILTDYDFKGHPFRKDFPLIGYEEVRYDAHKERVIYEPVTSVTLRTSVPKVIRATEETHYD